MTVVKYMDCIVRIIAYLLLLAIHVLIYIFLHSHFYFILLVAMVTAPLLTAAANFWLRRSVSVEILAGTGKEAYARKREETFFYLKVKNTSWAMSLDAKVSLTIANTFFGTEGTFTVSVPVHMHGTYELEIPVIPDFPGIVTLTADAIRVKDLLGFFYLKKKVASSASVTVMPSYVGKGSYDRTAVESGMLESEESSKRGNDFSDVQEIREYIPGDKLMSIHWKLSAKRDVLMVKDRVSMSDRQLVIVPELLSDHMMLDAVVEATYGLIRTLIEDGTTVRLMYWSMGSYDYQEFRIDYASDLETAFARMYYERTYQVADEAATHMAQVHPEIKSYLYVTGGGSGADVFVRENG